jgi:hypothetical protein
MSAESVPPEGSRVKNWPPETVRLAQAALETRDSLRRLAAKITAAGDNPQLRAEALAAAHQVANTHADLLRLALKDSGARRHNVAIPEARPLWAVGLNGRNGDRQ